MATTNLNKVIDENSYPTRETEISNLNHRPIGLGVQGLADVFALLKIPFYSPQAKMVNIQIFEEIYYAALKASNELARVHGPYSSFEGSPASKGILQYDMWGVEPINKDRFDHLKESIKTIGLYNSLLVAPMPTASTAQIMGNNEAFEPFKSNMYVRRVLAGEFNVVNKHLVAELEKLGLWNEQMKADIMYGGGSVQDIESIPQELRDIYKTSYEMSMKDIIQMAADRGAFIDQSQSMNLFVTDPTIGKISSMHMYSWKKGLKTGMYYLRSKNKVTANKGLGLEAIHNPKPADPPQSDDFDCIGCGS
jgi:ribonucleotide reductase alpha subunit